MRYALLICLLAWGCSGKVEEVPVPVPASQSDNVTDLPNEVPSNSTTDTTIGNVLSDDVFYAPSSEWWKACKQVVITSTGNGPAQQARYLPPMEYTTFFDPRDVLKIECLN